MPRTGVQIVGIGESRHGRVPGVTADELMAEAAIEAIADAGLQVSDVDGVFTTSAHHHMPALTLSEHLGLNARYLDATSMGGSSFVAFVGHAAAAIEAGRCDVALVAYGSNQRSAAKSLATASEQAPLESRSGYRYPASGYALAAARHAYEYGTTHAQMAAAAVAARKWAAHHPKAFARDPITVDDVALSPVVSSPLTRLDCCLVTDGGAAFVLTKVGSQAGEASRNVRVLAEAEASEHRHISEMPDLTTTAARVTGRSAMRDAELEVSDIDVVMLYDAFTISVLLFLEDLGFCDKGDGGEFVAAGHIEPGGRLPVNTNGGGLAYTHPGMLGAFLVTEAVRQIRGEALGYQVHGAQTALVHGCGGVLSSHATAILGRT